MPKILKQYKVVLEKHSPDDNIVGNYPDNLGKRTKLGGRPSWIQSDATPICDTCNKSMCFIGQIDSIEHHDNNNPHSVDSTSPQQEYMFGDVGMIYVFFCFECGESKSLMQSY